MAIYTRTGDAGTTALFSGQRVSKTHPRVEAYGTLDELNSQLSLCACAVQAPTSKPFLEAVQLQIFWFSAELASESEIPSPKQRYVSTEDIAALEQAIDNAMSQVDNVHSFVLPGRCEAAARLHVARTLARKAERRLVELREQVNVRQVLMRYINRLSDCLYALARLEDHLAHQEKVIHEVATRYRAAAQAKPAKDTPLSLSFHDLHQLAKAAMARAGALNVPVVISVVDAHGIGMMTWRMPDALLVSSELAPKKAWTAVAMKSATHELSDAVQPGRALYGLEAHMEGKVVTFGGGFPIWRDGNIIGGLGISGGSVEQDMDIAQTALAAIKTGKKMMNTTELETLIRTILSEQLTPAPKKKESGTNGVFTTPAEAINAAHQAFLRYQQCPLKTRSAIISGIRDELAPCLAELAEESATETGMGNKQDKFLKNKAALENTPGIEDLTTSALTGDGGMVLFEYSPFGVIGSVAPSTNPTETIINNSISMLAAGNTIYFSPHPGAKKVSLKLIRMIEEIAFRHTGIRNLVVTVAEPTFEATQQMMAHPKIALLAITGGPGIVLMGLKSGKKVIGAGAGNPPCIVDETADLVKAAEDIINGASFDYNLPCIAEKSLIVVDCVADRLMQQMQAFGALRITGADIDKLRAVCIQDGVANKKLVGKSPAQILQAAGLSVPPKTPRLLIAEVQGNDPLVTAEQLMPVLPVVRVNDFDAALALALVVEEGLHHTAVMHSQNVSRLNLAARSLQTSIFVKNGPSYAGIGVGGEGFTTFTIATPTGEGTTSAKTFARSRRCVLTNGFSIR